MGFDVEKEIGRLWRNLHSAQGEIGRVWYRWREAVLGFMGPGVNPLEVSLRVAEVMGREIGRGFLSRLNWLKGEEAWLMGLAGSISAQWVNHGALVRVEKGDGQFEVFIRWERCPWPSFAKEYGVGMEEDLVVCDRILQSILVDVNVFFNVRYGIETLKAIPRGEGMCLRRLYKI